MTAITFKTEPRAAHLAPKRQGFRSQLSDALDAFATHWMQRAVPAAAERAADQPVQDSPVRLPESAVIAPPRPLAAWLRAAKRAGLVILGFAIFAHLFVAAMVLRLAIWVPALRG